MNPNVLPFSSIYPLAFWLGAVLRLLATCQFQAFLGSGAFVESARCYCFEGVASLSWRSAFSWAARVLPLRALCFDVQVYLFVAADRSH